MSISIVEIRNLFRWWFSYCPAIVSDPVNIDKHFWGFNYEEFESSERGKLSEVCAGLDSNSGTPVSGSSIEAGTMRFENLYIDVYCVKSVAASDYEAQLEAQQYCKNILDLQEQWIYQMKISDRMCDYPAIEFIEMDNVTQSAVENFGEREAYGWRKRYNFKNRLPAKVAFTYPPNEPYPPIEP